LISAWSIVSVAGKQTKTLARMKISRIQKESMVVGRMAVMAQAQAAVVTTVVGGMAVAMKIRSIMVIRIAGQTDPILPAWILPGQSVRMIRAGVIQRHQIGEVRMVAKINRYIENLSGGRSA
jgi:hypothetical protein